LCFQKYFINLLWQHSCIVSQIGNADQTQVCFEMPLDTTVHKKGDKKCHSKNWWQRKTAVYGNVVHYGGWQKIAAIHHLEKKDSAKSECERCDHPSPRIRLNESGSGTRLD
jgi:hypothetical protein